MPKTKHASASVPPPVEPPAQPLSRDTITLSEIHKARLQPFLALIDTKKLELADHVLEALGLASMIGQLGREVDAKVRDVARLYQIDPEDQATDWHFDVKAICFRRGKKPA